MEVTPKLRARLLMQNGIFVVLLIAVTALLAFFAREYRGEYDLTQSSRNTLTQQTRDALAKLSGPIKVTVYATKQVEVRKPVQEFLAPYQRAKPDLAVTLVDPREEPKLAQAAGIRADGESVIEYNQKSEHLTEYNEQSFVNLLMRLARSGERLAMALEGHGERRLTGVANHDLGEFGKQLAGKGFKTNGLNLAIAQEVPSNASMLLLTHPQVDLQAGEVQKLKQYVQKGGNLLWLIDTEPLHGLQPIAEQLGITLGPGTVVDPDAGRVNASPTVAVGASYGRHPITDNFRLNTVFPFSRQIGVNEKGSEGGDWKVTRLVEVAPRGWVEMGKLDGAIAFDKSRDVPGPITIAVALERTVGDRAQRVVVVGNGNFLSNQFLGNGGNLELGVNMVNWLAGDDALITIQPRPSRDSSLALGTAAQYVMLFGFLIFLPLAFVSTGVLVWWRRRKA
ncbi:MAG: transporter [Betaproteobacteria bacterium]|nr:transporter [Betaproteobacteria bacterium]